LPTPEQIEVAGSLARLAAIDLATAEKLAPDPEMDDRPVGFHAQQAVEKAVKVALMLAGIAFPKTHDLEYLIVLAEKHSIAMEPESWRSARFRLCTAVCGVPSGITDSSRLRWFHQGRRQKIPPWASLAWRDGRGVRETGL
jgi:HEPN domain-containing protein